VLLRVYEVLLDGQWHPLPQVLLEGSKAVPPGMAQRVGRTTRRHHHSKQSERPVVSTGPVADDIRMGQRRVARTLIGRAVARGQLELDNGAGTCRRDWVDPSRYVRLAERALGHAAEEVAWANGSSAT
jgi:hypothetical protein